MSIWWLSFRDTAAPGDQFRGVCLVEAADFPSAVMVAHARGINPGGQVLGFEGDPEVIAALSFSLEPYMNRLYPTRDEADALDRLFGEECLS